MSPTAPDSSAPRLTGKVAIVTGASSGIGREIAVAMAAAGAGVLAVGRDGGRTRAVAAELRDRGGTAEGFACDVCEEGAAERIVEAALALEGHIDVVVPAAGYFEPAPFEQATLEALDRHWQVNVRAPYALLQRAIGPLRESRGSVIFISSTGGQVGFPGAAGYCASKGAVEMLTRTLALEYAGTGVRVNAVAPGNVRTPMNSPLLEDPAVEEAMLEATPAGRIGEVRDIAPAVVFLASDAADYVHGATFTIDGGWIAR